MAAARYPSKPGTKFGPCKGKCNHKDCEAQRQDAKQLCRICGQPIGYDHRVYSERVGKSTQFVHADCLEREAEKA